MEDIITNYPWMIVIICGCCVALVLVLISLIVVSKKSKGYVSDEDKEQQQIIDEYINEVQNKTNDEPQEIIHAEILPLKVETTEVIKGETKEVKEVAKVSTTKTDKPVVKSNTKKTEVKTAPKTVSTTKKPVQSNNSNKTKSGGNIMSTKTVTKKAPQGKYEIFEVEGTDSFKYILKASNGEKLIESDLYASKENVKNAIDAIQRNLEAGSYNITKDKNGMFQFKLTAANNRPIAVSANYVSKQNAEKALESFKRFASDAKIVEIEEPKDSLIEEIEIEKMELQVNGKIVISSNDNTWSFKLYANNGELLCSSKPYSSKANCEEGVETFKTSVLEGKFLVFRDKNKLYQFRLQTQSKRLVAVGQTYEDKQRAVSSANSVASFIDSAKIVIE